jgi:hypothetical protein
MAQVARQWDRRLAAIKQLAESAYQRQAGTPISMAPRSGPRMKNEGPSSMPRR